MAYSRPPLTLGPDSETTGTSQAILELVLYPLECQALVTPVLLPFLSFAMTLILCNSCKTAKTTVFQAEEGGAKRFRKEACQPFPSRWIVPAD